MLLSLAQPLEKVEIEYVAEKPVIDGAEGYEELLEVFNKFTPSEDTSKADVSRTSSFSGSS